jgi:hypothetical protein
MEHAEEVGHLLVQKAVAWAVRLDPFAIDDELRNRPFANVLDDFLSRPGGALNIDLGVRNLVLFKESLGLAAIAAPRSGIDQNLHPSILPSRGLDHPRRVEGAPFKPVFGVSGQ